MDKINEGQKKEETFKNKNFFFPTFLYQNIILFLHHMA